MRLQPIGSGALSAEPRPLYEDMKTGIAAKYSGFATIRQDGAILGPWGAWLHEPALGSAIWDATKPMTRFKHLCDSVRQVVILVVGSRFRATYQIYAHSTVARTAGFTEEQIAAIVAGRKPAGLSAESGTAYDAATALLDGGVHAASVHDKALGQLGQHGVNELIYLVGHYCFVSMTLNGFDIPAAG
jgi:4-carboxymuconolactone decarboxylase